ncbi:Aste57867_9865 [Aphanomyces stellatus]|uniref:Aste57867_9865 protein n=1 Tax=Aphanomyces stellatus TaxID=120398 RepID=A0A485KNX6_9STRA|nr:hypothetical protein As57867_009826 [Aphanomyces stellatus]VFT86744.1 Aste57867_9865 [Aphanomyces stellatus]
MHVVPLSHPRADMEVCVFTDASDKFWGAVATQVPPSDLDKPLEEQRHEPLAFISGTFAGASVRRPIVEKEAYAVVEACKRLDYLIVRPGGFRLFTDHRNLVYMFNPRGSNGTLAKYQADKLQRWALVMSTFPYTIECLPGDVNVWGDLLSRWGSTPTAPRVAHVRRLVHVMSPLQLADFEWPTATSFLTTQKVSIEGGESTPPGVAWNRFTPTTRTASGCPTPLLTYRNAFALSRIKVPRATAALPRRRNLSLTSLSGRRSFKTWTRLSEAVFTACKSMGTLYHAQWARRCRRGRVSRLGGVQVNKAAHVILDNEDVLEPARWAFRRAEALMAWFILYGCVDTWVTDGGSHFKNEVIEKIRKMVGAHHHITTAYSPWANGTAEFVDRLVLRAVKALLSEMRLKVNEWHLVLPLVQCVLIHQPADRLGGVAPVTAFTGLPAKTPMSGFVHPTTKEVHCVDFLDDVHREHMDALAAALNDLHRDVAARSDKLRQQARGRRDKKAHVKFANFAVGDYVLVGSVVQRSNKLALQWRGPKQVVRVVTDHVMETQQLVPTYGVSTHHAYRLKMY